MSKKIDLNCDMGELDRVGDELFMPYISSCNISCGAHSGSIEKITQTIQQAIQHQLNIGAHPAYPDKANFGRQSMTLTPKTFEKTILEQLYFINKIVNQHGGQLHHIKAHGALYNDMTKNETLLNTFLDIVKAFNPNLKIYALALPKVKKQVEAKGFTFVGEAFIDRRYTADLTLQSRKIEGAVLQNIEQVLSQIDYLLSNQIQTVSNEIYPIHWQTICLHSDTPHAEKWCTIIYNHIKAKGFDIA